MPLSLSKKICDVLIEKDLVTQEGLDKARDICSKKGGSLSDVLVEMGTVTRESILTVLSIELGFPPINLTNITVDNDVLELIPKKIATMYKILPLSKIGKLLSVAMVDPLNILALDDLKIITNLDMSPVIVAEDDMKEALRRYYEAAADAEISAIVDEIDKIESMNVETIAEGEEAISSRDMLKLTEEAPVVKLTNMILRMAIKERAGDILIEPMEGESRVRYRIDGILNERYTPPKEFHSAIVSRLKVLSDLNISERRLPQDGRFRVKIEGRKIDFRISVVPSSFGEKVALRILDKEQARTELDKLGFKQRDIDRLQEAGKKPHGMILVCGPTGCGKTTTLYSILRDVDDPSKNLITVEDPVEYELIGVNQVSINADIGLTFSSCLRSILRQDPDIIMVGEIRDYDTLDVAIKSALTGHLVLSTLHTNTAAGSIVRMVNMGIEPFLITSSVELIAAQRLLRKLCIDCREPYTPSKEMADKYGLFDEKGKIARVYRPVGCKRCLNSGYKGRIGIIECMKLTPLICDLIFGNAQEAEIEKASRAEGMVTLRQNGIENVIEGITSLEEVLRTTIENREMD